MHFQLQRSIWTRFGEGKKNVSHRHCLDKHSHLPRSPFHPMTPFAFTLSSWPAQHPFPVCCSALMKSPCKCMGDSFQASTPCISRASQLAAKLQLVESCLSQLCIGEVVLIGAVVAAELSLKSGQEVENKQTNKQTASCRQLPQASFALHCCQHPVTEVHTQHAFPPASKLPLKQPGLLQHGWVQSSTTAQALPQLCPHCFSEAHALGQHWETSSVQRAP